MIDERKLIEAIQHECKLNVGGLYEEDTRIYLRGKTELCGPLVLNTDVELDGQSHSALKIKIKDGTEYSAVSGFISFGVNYCRCYC